MGYLRAEVERAARADRDACRLAVEGCQEADSGGVSRVTDSHLAGWASWPQPVIPKPGTVRRPRCTQPLST